MINRNVILLSLAFFFIFFGYNSVQQFITSFYSSKTGFYSLTLIFCFFFLAGPFSAVTVSKFGAKKNMAFAAFFYFLFIISLISNIQLLVYLSSVLIGISAALLWTGQNSYLVKASSERSYGGNSGLFNTFLSLGSALGVIILGLLVSSLGYSKSFILLSALPLLGILVISRLKDLQSVENGKQLAHIKSAISSPNALRLAMFYLAFSVINGLFIGIIPLIINNSLGVAFIGILSALFFIMPIALSYPIGKISDIVGRKLIIILGYFFAISGLILLSLSTNTVALVSGVLILAAANSVFRPIGFALVGDVSTQKNVESISALVWMAQNFGTILGISGATILTGNILFVLSSFILVVSLLLFFPFLRLEPKNVKESLSKEIT